MTREGWKIWEGCKISAKRTGGYLTARRGTLYYVTHGTQRMQGEYSINVQLISMNTGFRPSPIANWLASSTM